MVQLLKSASIRDDIDRLQTQLEDARMNFLVSLFSFRSYAPCNAQQTTMTIDTNRNVASGFAKISQENHNVLAAVSNLMQATSPENMTGVNDYTSEVGLIWLCEVLQRGLQNYFVAANCQSSRLDIHWSTCFDRTKTVGL